MAHSRNHATRISLDAILSEVHPFHKKGYMCMNECYPGLYIGDSEAAENKRLLVRHGITHVLNAAASSVNTDAMYYSDVNIKYIGMRLQDDPLVNIAKYFDSGVQFIDDALSNGGKVLVHCVMGISRSATISCAFLMMKRSMSSVEALLTIRKKRAVVHPNEGFLDQLADLDKKLRKEQDRGVTKKLHKF